MESRLKFKIVSYSSEDKEHPVSNLLVKGSSGWQSGRFCSYPQQITLQFYSQVHIKQLQFLSNCRKISSRIDILSFSDRDNVDSRFSKYGFLQLSTNEHTNYQGRQLKTIMVDIHCTYLRFLLHKPHTNKQNFFSQVGLHEISVLGEGLEVITEPTIKSLGGREAIVGGMQPEGDDRTIEDEFIHSKMLILLQLKDHAVKQENYEEANRLKEILHSVRTLGYQIRGLEDKKREAVQNQDYHKAQKIKGDIERIRMTADGIIANVSNPNYQNYNRIKTAKIPVQEQKDEEIGLDKSRITNRTLRPVDNEFVNEFKERDEEMSVQALKISYDQRVLPTHLGKQKTEVREDDPPPDARQNLPAEPQPLTAQKEKDAVVLLTLFDEITVRSFYSSYWQFRLEALKTFINQVKNPSKTTKGKDQNLLFKVYMNIVANTIGEKVVQLSHNSLALLQQLLLLNKKIHNEARIHEFQADADAILNEVIKRMNDNNVKTKGLADEIYRKMAESGLYGIATCSNALMRISPGKPSPKLSKSKLDTLTYFINLHGLGPHAVPANVVDFALSYVDNQNADVRNSAIDLLVTAALNGAEDRVRSSVEKMTSNLKEMITKKINNAKAAKQGSLPNAKKPGKASKK